MREEDVIQSRCKGWLDLAYARTGLPDLLFAFHTPNERASARERAVLARFGVRKGVPDWIFPGRGAVEVKTQSGRLSPEQRAFLEHFKARGYEVAVVRSAREFGEFVNKLFGIDVELDAEVNYGIVQGVRRTTGRRSNPSARRPGRFTL